MGFLKNSNAHVIKAQKKLVHTSSNAYMFHCRAVVIIMIFGSSTSPLTDSIIPVAWSSFIVNHDVIWSFWTSGNNISEDETIILPHDEP